MNYPQTTLSLGWVEQRYQGVFFSTEQMQTSDQWREIVLQHATLGNRADIVRVLLDHGVACCQCVR